ncbi:MAG: UpxY family transcription antiterminator [Bryobacteraceae bacterium]
MTGEIVSRREWFAMRVRTNYERSFSRAMEFRGFDSFLPTYQRARAWSDRIKQIHQPLFPGYVFCRLNHQERTPALLAPGAMCFVGIGTSPIPIPEAEIESLKTLISSFQVKPWPFLRLGQKVRIERGPLAGVEGVIEAFRSGYRIVVSIELLQRSVAAELEGNWLTPLIDTIDGLSKGVRPVSTAAQNFGNDRVDLPSAARHRVLPRAY